MTPITQSWITDDGFRVYKAGRRYFKEAVPLVPCTPEEVALLSGGPVTRARDVLACVGKYFELPEAELLSPSRKEIYYYPRHLCAYLLWADYGMSWQAIGKTMNRDRKAAKNGCEVIQAGRHQHQYIRIDLQNLRDLLCKK